MPVDRHFSDPKLTALYDAFCAGRADFRFYLPLIMSSRSVLDVGCGTGALLHVARQAGHTGRLCGLDPAEAMLDRARTGSDIEWVLGDLGSVGWRREFELVVMTGHAFQVFVDDHTIQAALASIRTALVDDGRFAFETRNPLVRGWEAWTPRNAVWVVDESGAHVQMAHQVDLPVNGDIVTFTTTYTSPTWDEPRISRSTLRFLKAGTLSRFLTGADLTIEQQYGDWDETPVTETSPEIITIARAAP